MSALLYLVNVLRRESAASLSLCKRAAEAGNGDIQLARNALASLIKDTFVINSVVNNDMHEGLAGGIFSRGILSMLMVRCRSDFASRSAIFGSTCQEILDVVYSGGSCKLQDEKIQNLSSTIKEPISISQMTRLEIAQNHSVFTYVHKPSFSNFGTIFAAVVLENLPQDQIVIGGKIAKHVGASTNYIEGVDFSWLLEQKCFDNELITVGSMLKPYSAHVSSVYRLSIK